jgi:hypothetical protein
MSIERRRGKKTPFSLLQLLIISLSPLSDISASEEQGTRGETKNSKKKTKIEAHEEGARFRGKENRDEGNKVGEGKIRCSKENSREKGKKVR